ncbi:MAG: Fe-S cluster assembly protein SufD [Pirellulales bacterium]
MSHVGTEAMLGPAGLGSFLDGRVEPSWLTQSRKQAWELFQKLEWPSRKSEEWMRSDLRGFHYDRYPFPGDSTEVEGTLVPNLLEGLNPAGRLSVVDGIAREEQGMADLASKGVVFGSLEKAAVEHEELVQRWLHKLVPVQTDRFTALHAATWCGGQILYVPRNVAIAEPFYVHASMRDGGTDTGHTLIVLEDGAEATFVYESTSPHAQATGLHCGSVEIVVGQGAHLRYVNLQDWGRGVWHFAHQRAQVGRDASLQWTIAGMGAKFAQVSQQVALVGEGASSQVNGVMFTQDRQQMTYNTLQHHRKPHCTSDFLYKSALQDQSRTVWRGMIKVDPLAFKTDGYQRNDNLLLSDKSRADSIPGLEIEADDVRCTHGSTSGKVDEELIFYAQSRGFTRREATRMIVTGFFQQIFDRITIESVRESLGKAIAKQVREYE